MTTAADTPELVGSTLAPDDRVLRPWYRFLTALVAVLVCLPVWLTPFPPLVDYPNHLARDYILYHYAGDALLRERYAPDLAPIPALATDAVLVALQPFLDIYTAGRLFLTLSLLLYYFGGHLLGRAIHGRPTWLALGTALFCYPSMFFYGFTNYCFSLGLFLVGLAAWLAWSRRWGVMTWLLFQALVFACYFAHLAGYALLGGAVAVITLRRLVRVGGWRYHTLGLVPLVPPAVVFVLCRTGLGSDEGIVWSTLTDKVVGGLCLVRTFHDVFDGLYLVLLLGLVVATALAARRVQADREVLLAGAAFVLLFLLGPKEIHGGGAPADARFLPAAAPLLLLAWKVVLPRRRAAVLFGFWLLLIAGRLGGIAGELWPMGQAVATQVALFDHLPEGARLYPIVGTAADAATRKRDRALFHAAHYATVERRAFVPTLMAYPGQQPIRLREPPVSYHGGADRLPALGEVDWPRVLAAYDYLWGYQLPPDYDAYLRARCDVVASADGGVLYRVRRRA